jgi:hypothetical protein
MAADSSPQLCDPSKDLRAEPQLMNGTRKRKSVNSSPAASSWGSSSSAASSSSAVAAASSPHLRDPSKDLRAKPQLMNGTRKRKSVNHQRQGFAPAAQTEGGGGVERAASGKARKRDVVESDSEDSEPIALMRKR